MGNDKAKAVRVALNVIDTALEELQELYDGDDRILNIIAGVSDRLGDLEAQTQLEE